ncbi:MAG: circadian clock protein KaiA [Leptolyngbyaceae cyanobacterium SM2_3_12]|nr:circadian clock protein KaiA [Leptolyngbyaceae cyanobacterium SM2_3_12]
MCGIKNCSKSFTSQGIVVPTVVVVADDVEQTSEFTEAYHGGVVTLGRASLPQLETAIQRAIQQFLELPADSCTLPNPVPVDQLPIPDILSAQQGRLTEKLKARLGYLGVYYKRTPENFLRNLSPDDRETLLNQLKANYRKIVLGYFTKDVKLNQAIDDLVDQAFMADISVSYIVEIHMVLMDEFAKQLKLEGRSEEILLDYRLTLIDVMAHLCEMYRRSIPRDP